MVYIYIMEGNGGVNVEMSMVTMVIVEYCVYTYNYIYMGKLKYFTNLN